MLRLIYRVQITFHLGCKQQKNTTENYMQDMAKILRNVQCLFLGLKDLTPNMQHNRSPGIIPNLYMSPNLKVRLKEPVHN